MKIIKPSFEILDAVDGSAVLRKIEQCGRVCYKSESRITPDSAERFVRNVIQRGHESVIEHVAITGKFVCDRGVTHEIVRHRIASYSQESTRYVRYGSGALGEGMEFIDPCGAFGWEYGSTVEKMWRAKCAGAEHAYAYMLDAGIPPEQARDILPNSIKTELVMTANLREWRHFFRLRCSERAHPQMREVSIKALVTMHEAIPVVFDDLFTECLLPC